MKLGDTVCIIRSKADEKDKPGDEFLSRSHQTCGTVVYMGRRFFTVALCADGGKFLYRESFRPEQVKKIKIN